MSSVCSSTVLRVLCSVVLFIIGTTAAMCDMPDLTTAPTETVAISVDTAKLGRPFTCLDRGVDPHWIAWYPHYEHLWPLLKANGFDMIRIMGVLSNTEMYTEKTKLGADGKPIYDYSKLDAWLDPVIKAGLRPFFVMNCVPTMLSKHPTADDKQKEINNDVWVSAPTLRENLFYSWKSVTNEAGVKDYVLWEGLIYKTFVHFQKRYGKDKVATWLVEVWNEGDYGDYGAYQFDANFLETMDHTVNAVKRADPRIRIGGPGSVSSTYRRGGKHSKGRSIEEAPDWYDYIQHTAVGTNYATGRKGTPIDFITSHMYDWSGQRLATDNAAGIFKWMMDTVDSFPQHAGKPVIISEWMGAALDTYKPHEPSARDGKYDVPYVAARELRTMVQARNAGLSGMIHHSMTAPPYYKNKMFTGFPSVCTLQGVRTPQGAMLSLYNKLDGLEVDLSPSKDELGGIAAVSGNVLRVMLYHCPDEPGKSITRGAELKINWPAAAGRKVRVKKYIVDAECANARGLWHTMGEPLEAAPEQLAQLKSAAEIPTRTFQTVFDSSGQASIFTTMTSPAVQLFELTFE